MDERNDSHQTLETLRYELQSIDTRLFEEKKAIKLKYKKYREQLEKSISDIYETIKKTRGIRDELVIFLLDHVTRKQKHVDLGAYPNSGLTSVNMQEFLTLYQNSFSTELQKLILYFELNEDSLIYVLELLHKDMKLVSARKSPYFSLDLQKTMFQIVVDIEEIENLYGNIRD